MFSVKSVFKFLSTPKAYGHYIITDIIFRVTVVSLAFGRATNQKNETRIAQRYTD